MCAFFPEISDDHALAISLISGCWAKGREIVPYWLMVKRLRKQCSGVRFPIRNLQRSGFVAVLGVDYAYVGVVGVMLCIHAG